MSRKILDEKGRLFGVINIVDVIVIILAIVIVCGDVYKRQASRRTERWFIMNWTDVSRDIQTESP